MSRGKFHGVVRCLQCDTATRSTFGASFSTSAEERFGVGDDLADEIDGLDEAYVVVRRPAGEDVVLLETWSCPLCRREDFAQITVDHGSIASIDVVPFIQQTLRRAHFVTDDIAYHYVRITGSEFFSSSGRPADWYDVLLEALPRTSGALETRWPRVTRSGNRLTVQMPGGEGLAELVTAIAGNDLADEVGVQRGELRLSDAVVVCSVDDASRLPDEVRRLRRKDDGHDTWIVATASGGPTWRFVSGDALRSLRAQVQVLSGPSGSTTSAATHDSSIRVVDDQWLMVGRQRGTPGGGVHVGMTRSGRSGRITTRAGKHAATLATWSETTTGGTGLAEVILARAIVTADQEPIELLLEAEPPGTALSTLRLPLTRAEATRLARSLLGWLAVVHTETAGVGGLRPETVYVAGADVIGHRPIAVSGVAARGEVFLAEAVPPTDPSYPYRWIYQAPEVLAGGASTPASDVFSGCAILAHAAAGEHPFEGDDRATQLDAIRQGRRRPSRRCSLLAALDGGLAMQPGGRASLSQLEAALDGLG